MTITRTKKILIVMVVGNILAGGAYAGAFFLTRQTIIESANRSAELSALREQGDDNIFLKQLTRQFEGGEGVLDAHIVYADDVVRFIDRVESLAQVAGVSVKLSGLRENGANGLSFDVRTVGTFSGTLHLMSLIEGLPYVVEIKKASLVKNGASWAGDFNVDLTGFIKQ